MRIKQVQNGHWTVVWPKAFTAGGATLADQLKPLAPPPSVGLHHAERHIAGGRAFFRVSSSAPSTACSGWA